MVNLTAAQKAAFNPDNGNGPRHIDWSVRFEIIQQEVYGNLTPTASSQDSYISRIAQTVNGNLDSVDWASYELNGCPLDGSKLIPPTPSQAPDAQIGLVMNVLSDANGNFASAQTYTATAAYNYNLIAITLIWGYAPAADFSVRWYNGTTLLHTETVTGNTSVESVLNVAVQNVNRVVVSVTKSALPLHRCRLANFVPGAIGNYDKTNSDSLMVEEVADLSGERAVSYSMKLVTDNFAREFNIFEPDGIYSYFQERMLLKPKIAALAANGEWVSVDMGSFYLTRPLLKGNLSKLELEANGLIGMLQDMTYIKGTYKTATLARFALDVAEDAGISITYPSSFNSISMTSFASVLSHADLLMRIAQATGTVLVQRRNDTLEFVAPVTTAMQTLTAADYRLQDGISPADDKIFNTVVVDSHSMSIASSNTELARAPVSGSVTGITYYAERAVYTVGGVQYTVSYGASAGQSYTVSGGEIIISGRLLNITASPREVTIRQQNEPAYIKEVRGNYFIQAVNVATVAARQLDIWANKRREVKIGYPGYPYFEMGDVVNYNTGGSNTQGFVLTKNRLTLAGGMRGDLGSRER